MSRNQAGLQPELMIIADKSGPETSRQHLVKMLDIASTLSSAFEMTHIVTYFYRPAFKDVAIPPNVCLHLIDEWPASHGLIRLWHHALYLVKLFALAFRLLRKNPQIRVVMNPYGHYLIGLMVIVLAKLEHRKALIRIACEVKTGVITARSRYGPIGGAAFAVGFGLTEKFVLHFADGIIAVSPTFLMDQPRFQSKTAVIPKVFPIVDQECCAGHQTPATQSPAGRVRALCVSRFAPEKGVDTLLNALAQCPTITCTIVGDGELDGTLRKMAHDLGLEDRVEFTGAIRQSEVFKQMRTTDFLVVPSLNDYFPSVIIEAAAFSLPCVATDVGGVRYLVLQDETGLLCKGGDVPSLASAMTRMAADGECRQQQGVRAKAMVCTNYTEDRIRANANAFCRELLH